MKERVLFMTLRKTVEEFAGSKWKFFEVKEEDNIIKVDSPKGSNERYVVELSYTDEAEKEHIVQVLEKADFIKSTIRIVSDF